MDQTPTIAWDSETFRIGPGELAPPMVCASFAYRDEDGKIVTQLISDGDGDELESFLEAMLENEDLRIVTHNGAYDYAVLCRTFPRLIPAVFELLESGRATDTLLREKLLNLSDQGRLVNLPLPGGGSKRLSYSLGQLAMDYFGLDLSADKDDTEESWRLHYGQLSGWASHDYPEDARRYAIDDPAHTLEIYEAQEERKRRNRLSTETEEFQLYKSFDLRLKTVFGIEVDREMADALETAVVEVLEDTREDLERVGFIRPLNAIGPPYVKDEERAFELLYELFDDLPIEIEDWTPYADALREQGIRFKKPEGTPGSRNTAVIQKHFERVYKQIGEIPELTPAGKLKADAEIREHLANYDPTVATYHRRQELSKLSDQMVPMLKSGETIHAAYDSIKETGRTSAYDGGKNRDGSRMFASVNIQQIPNDIKGLDARRCFKPGDGRVFIDVDFTALELACVAHVTYGLFGRSVHRELYNAGVDLHGYLGAQLALKDDGTGHALVRDFQAEVRSAGVGSNPLATYELFRALKQHDEKEVQEFFKHFRGFAKPVGLGFPGGLGPATFVNFARATYGVTTTEEQATAFRTFWRETYPEMVDFFNGVNGAVDDRNIDLEGSTLYTYTSPMGMVRRGATFCAAANGWSMQTPGAEAAMTGSIMVTRACVDPSQESVLYGCRPVAFIHDQVLVETTTDRDLWAAQCDEVARLMRAGAEMVLDSVKMRTDDAMLTSVWSKLAQPTFSEKGQMIPWTPAA